MLNQMSDTTSLLIISVIALLSISLLILVYLIRNTDDDLTGMWEAPQDFCKDSGLMAFCLCLKRKKAYVYDGYILVSNTAGILANQDFELLVNTKNNTIQISNWENTEVLPSVVKFQHWKEKNKLMLYSEKSQDKQVHVILYKNAEMTDHLCCKA